jgi:hypothetical protein
MRDGMQHLLETILGYLQWRGGPNPTSGHHSLEFASLKIGQLQQSPDIGSRCCHRLLRRHLQPRLLLLLSMPPSPALPLLRVLSLDLRPRSHSSTLCGGSHRLHFLSSSSRGSRRWGALPLLRCQQQARHKEEEQQEAQPCGGSHRRHHPKPVIGCSPSSSATNV